MRYLGLAVANLSARSSPTANTDLICHTENSLDCYPRTFQPSEDFQIVHDDQDLPAGLHIRLNINTGQKEARLNTPPKDDEARMENLHLEQAVVVVPQPEGEDERNSPALQDIGKLTPPLYEAAGKIMPPRGSDGYAGESEAFIDSLRILSNNPLGSEDRITPALSTLLELAHDIYYGVELAKRADAVHHLLNLMSFDDLENHIAAHRRRQAASILGGSIQNNPTALIEMKGAWNSLMRPHCGKSYGNIVCEDDGLTNKIIESIRQESDPAVMKAKVYVLSGLAKDKELRDDFLAKNGMELLLSISIKKGESWDGVRKRIHQFVIDTFLDESMGAELGIWPKGPASDRHRCSVPKYSTENGCWEYHLENVDLQTLTEGEEDWRTEFLKLMRQRRSSYTEARYGREL